ncbi:DUF2878 domain-containing protein [Pseudoalteromonas sp. YIC-827]|uniref:DUF2878 domain-containing protein n=1 Tax=Pseudoalteromonas qingdaonensis TaxID=3131913 RepID=A0ABU9MX40_9GAMM
MTRRWLCITNFLLFQTCWWAAFYAQQRALPVMVLCLLIMLWLSSERRRDFYLCITLVLAFVCEALAQRFGLLQFADATVPVWLLLLWLALILTINHSLAFIKRLPWWQCLLLCWLCAPSSYITAAHFEIFALGVSWWQFYLLYGGLWAVTFTLMIVINRHLKHVVTHTS